MNTHDLPLTVLLAQAALNSRPAPEVQEQAMHSLMDSIGCLIAGTCEPSTEVARRYIRQKYGSMWAESSAAGLSEMVSTSAAALVNGIAINAHDFDDVCVAMNGHPSAVVLSAAMAVAQKEECNGEQLLHAYITGVEIIGMLGSGLCPDIFHKGWHSTATLGIFGAVAAVGILKNVSQEILSHAFALTASEASGVKGNLGSDAKTFHCGRTAEKAIEVVELIQSGCRANLNALEGPGGLLSLLTDRADVNRIRSMILQPVSVFLSPGIGLKAYPSCKCSFTGIDAMLYLRKKHDFKPEDVQEAVCRIQPGSYENLKFHSPRTPMEKKLSLEYCLAAALIDGGVILPQFQPEFDDAALQQIMERLQVLPDAALETAPEDTSELTVITRDGSRYFCHMEAALGDPEKPMSEQERKNKFISCCSLTISREQACQLWDFLLTLPRWSNCRASLHAVISSEKGGAASA